MEILEQVKIIWEYLRKYKKAVVKTAVLAIIFSIVTALVPYIYGRLVDVVAIEAFSFNFVIALLLVWTLTNICSAVLGKLVSLKGGFIAIDAANDLICSGSKHIINLPLSFHKEKKVGEILSRITRGGEFLQQIIDLVVFWTLPQVLTIFVSVFILFFIDWRLSLGVLIIFLSFVAIIFYKTPTLLNISRKLNKKVEKGMGTLNDSFLNIQTIKSCAAEDFQKEKIENIYKKEIPITFKSLFVVWENAKFFCNIVFSLGFVAIFSFAIYLLKIDQISPGDLIMFLGYLSITKLPLVNLLWQWYSFQKGMTAIERARELLVIEPENYQQDGKIIKDIKSEVEFKNVSFGYKEKSLILKNINFKVKAGQTIALVGGSGEGKTTLIDLISLYFSPAKGSILIDGVDIRELNLQLLRKLIAYVPQEIILFNDTIKNNIRYGKPNAADEEIVAAAEAANARQFIEKFSEKYEQLVGERGIKLSTGQKQRLAIARALIRDPKILILDEATSSLDVASEKLVQEALEKLIKNRTTFIIAHRLSTVRQADKILVLEKGRIVEEGSHKELLKKKGAYFKFYSLQS